MIVRAKRSRKNDLEPIGNPVPLDDFRDAMECCEAFRPLPARRLITWSCANIVNDQGRPYDHAAFPHLGAPGGPMDAADDDGIRTIALQFATRLGKSFFGQCLLLSRVEIDPSPMLMASESEKSLKRIMRRTYKMVYQIPGLRRQLLRFAEKDHKQDHMEYRTCSIAGAWARSAGTLADMNIKIGVANELSKAGWDGLGTSTEAAPLKLFDERFKDYMSIRKIVYESTPTVRGRCRIERLRLASSNCQYWVPCPHCGRYQLLRMGEKVGDGKYDPEVPGRLAYEPGPKHVAKASAHYVCISGECEPILDEHRPWMMRRGVWAPEGCTVDDQASRAAAERWLDQLERELDGEEREPLWRGWKRADWIRGEPLRDGEDAGFQISSLYALSLGWGDIAAEYVATKDKPRERQNFVNSWLAETWEYAGRRQTWEDLGDRIRSSVPLGVVPSGYSLLTAGIDKQADGRHPFVVIAWDERRRSHTVAYGEADTLDEIENLLEQKFIHEDGGKQLRISMALIDSGFRPKGVGEFCRKMQRKKYRIHPCKGSSTPLEAVYRVRTQGKDSALPGMKLIVVDTLTTQDWIDQQLYDLKHPAPGSRTLFAASNAEHQDYLEQLLNDAAVSAVDSAGRDVIRWERPDLDVPNDFRDCERYAFAAMQLVTRGKAPTKRVPPEKQSKPREKPPAPRPHVQFLERPGGWLNDSWRR